MLIAIGLFRKCVIADNCALWRTRRSTGELGEPNLRRAGDRHLRVRLADLRRLQRLQRHRARRGAAAGLPLHGELPAALPGRRACRTSGGAGTSASAPGFATICTFRSAETGTGSDAPIGNLMLTMLLGGLWHGANWTFVIWGALHGAGLERRAVRPPCARLQRTGGSQPNAERMTPSSASGWLSRIAVFHSVCFTWVFFRTPSVGDAFRFLERRSPSAVDRRVRNCVRVLDAIHAPDVRARSAR